MFRSLLHRLASALSRWSARCGFELAHRLPPMSGRVPQPDDLGLIAHAPRSEYREHETSRPANVVEFKR